MKSAIAKAILVLSLLVPQNALASGTRSIATSNAQGLNGKTIELTVSSGYELKIDFIGVGETIIEASLGNPGSFTFRGLGGTLCPDFIPTPCKGTGSLGIYIRQIETIDFPHLTESEDGSTSLTIVTEKKQESDPTKRFKTYNFILKKGGNKPQLMGIKIVPDPDNTPIANDSIDDAKLREFRERIRNTNSQI